MKIEDFVLKCNQFIDEFENMITEDNHVHNSYDCWGEVK